MSKEQTGKKLEGKSYQSVSELPEAVQAVICGDMVLFTEDGVPYRKYVRHDSFSKYTGRNPDYTIEVVAIRIDSADPNRQREVQTLVALDGKIDADLWSEINNRNSESRRRYKEVKRNWKKANNKK